MFIADSSVCLMGFYRKALECLIASALQKPIGKHERLFLIAST